jgi:hypothetical protein
MGQMGPENTFTLETHLLRNPLGCMVLRVPDQLEALQPEIFECVFAEKAKRARGNPPTSSLSGAPVADVTRPRVVDVHPDRSDDSSILDDRELLRSDPRNLSLDEGACISLCIRARDCRNPVVNVDVIARGDNCRDVVQRPGAQLDVAVARFHLHKPRTTKGRFRGPSKKDNRRLPTLPGGCPPSTIGASRLNFSVRNGKRCFPAAMTAEVVRALRVPRTLKTP